MENQTPIFLKYLLGAALLVSVVVIAHRVTTRDTTETVAVLAPTPTPVAIPVVGSGVVTETSQIIPATSANTVTVSIAPITATATPVPCANGTQILTACRNGLNETFVADGTVLQPGYLLHIYGTTTNCGVDPNPRAQTTGSCAAFSQSQGSTCTACYYQGYATLNGTPVANSATAPCGNSVPGPNGTGANIPCATNPIGCNVATCPAPAIPTAIATVTATPVATSTPAVAVAVVGSASVSTVGAGACVAGRVLYEGCQNGMNIRVVANGTSLPPGQQLQLFNITSTCMADPNPQNLGAGSCDAFINTPSAACTACLYPGYLTLNGSPIPNSATWPCGRVTPGPLGTLAEVPCATNPIGCNVSTCPR